VRKGALGLSNSEMKSWRRCHRHWYLSHYRRMKKRAGDDPGSALSVGNLVHDALAAYYDPVAPVDPVEYADAAFKLEIEAHPSEETALRKEHELVTAMLKGYLEWLAQTGEDSNLTILGAEQTVRVPLRSQGEPIVLPNGETLHLLSKLDAPVERISDGQKLALEHKTTGDLNAPLIGYRIDAQFLTEHLARFLHAMEQGATPEEAYNDCSGILVNLLKKVKRTSSAKPPFYNRVDVPHNIYELRNHWKHVVLIATEIADAERRLDAGEDHHTVVPPTPLPDRCKWDCEFFRVCPLADDGSDFEGALNAIYEERDPLERYTGAEEM
jgi:hypothetical protein